MKVSKKFARMGALALSALMVLALAACGGNQPSGGDQPTGSGDGGTDTAPLKVGIIQLLEHTALTQAREGFVDALASNGYVDGDKVTLNVQIGSGDVNNLSTIADQLIADKSDLILAIATPSAQAVAGKTSTIPILGTAITDYEVAGLVESNDAPSRNVSGTTDMNPIEEQIDLLLQIVPDAKVIGFIYSSNEDNSRLQIDIAKGIVEDKGLTWKEVTIANSNDVQQACTSIASQVDALYLPTDNVLASTMPTVYSVSLESKTPVICAEQGMVENGGLATLGINYYDLGYQTGLMAIRALQGEDVSKMPIERSSSYDYYINGEVASSIGITIPSALQQYVH